MPRDDYKIAFYKDYEFVSNFQREEGLLVVPLCVEPGDGFPSVELVRVHAPWGQRVVEWKSGKEETPPVVPHPVNPQNANDVLLGTEVGVTLPSISTNQLAYNWALGGVYRYVQTTPRSPGTDNLPTGKFPFTTPREYASVNAGAYSTQLETQMSVPTNAQQVAAFYNTQNYGWPYGYMPWFAFDTTMIQG